MSQELDIIYEDNHLLVVNKPALLPTMGVGPDEASLVTEAKQYLKKKYSKPGNVYLGLVSRLDAFVSGIIVMARTSKAAARLNRQFSDGTAQKQYLAIVHGAYGQQQEDELTDWIVKDEKNHRMMTVSSGNSGAKKARLSYRTLGTFENESLLQIQLHTGRKHQIRVQFAARNRPIRGDKKYGSQTRFRKGIALHSHQLSILHPTLKETLKFRSDPPAWWAINRFLGSDHNAIDG